MMEDLAREVGVAKGTIYHAKELALTGTQMLRHLDLARGG